MLLRLTQRLPTLPRHRVLTALAAATAAATLSLHHHQPFGMSQTAKCDDTAAVSPTVAALSSASSYVAPPSSAWEDIRRIWIPTSPQLLFEAEQKTFADIQYPYDSRLVKIPADELMRTKKQSQWEINTLTLYNNQQIKDAAHASASSSSAVAGPIPVVMLHGFGAGISLWMSNFNHLAASFHRVDLVDMLGWGRSSRVDFDEYLERKIQVQGLKKRSGFEEEYDRAVASIAEEFTIDALESWRKECGHERMVLVAHSLGGYLSHAYARKYPERISSLVLVSPIGVPLPKEISISHLSWTAKRVIGFFRWSWWSANITPQSIVRALGRWGDKPVAGYVRNRFPDSPPAAASSSSSSTASPPRTPVSAVMIEGASSSSDFLRAELDDSLAAGADLAHTFPASRFDKNAVAEYLYQISAAKGSGEFAFAKLFDQSGHAKKPIIRSILQYKKQENDAETSYPSSTASTSSPSSSSTSPSLVPPPFPVTLMYGTSDWMDERAGRDAAGLVNAHGGRAQCVLVPQAGHQISIDNPKEFIKLLVQAVKFGRDNTQNKKTIVQEQ